MINRLLAAGIPVYWLRETQRTTREVWPPGSCWIVTDSVRLLHDLAQIYNVTFVAGRLASPQPAGAEDARIDFTSYLAGHKADPFRPEYE